MASYTTFLQSPSMSLTKILAKWRRPIARRSPPTRPQTRFVPEFQLLGRCELPSREIALDSTDAVIVQTLRRAGILGR